MNDDPFETSSPPPDEAWWERELYRNQKLMDRYMQVFEEEGETAFEKYDTPDKLYNKVHYGVEPGEPLPPEALAREAERDPEFEDWKEQVLNAAAAAAEEVEDELDVEEDEDNEELIVDDGEDDDDDEDEEEDDDEEWEEGDLGLSPEDEAAYRPVAKLARDFAVRVMDEAERGDVEEVLMLSAGKVGANLAGGHGLGYDEQTLCGNIVKCRWALADCLFCREMLEQMAQRTGDPDLAALVTQCEELAAAIRERIAALRARVWW